VVVSVELFSVSEAFYPSFDLIKFLPLNLSAPLVALPLLALAGTRETLTKTAARRQQIQDEIAANQKAAAKFKASADVDVGALVGSIVRS
jgi:hypothetical protein